MKLRQAKKVSKHWPWYRGRRKTLTAAMLRIGLDRSTLEELNDLIWQVVLEVTRSGTVASIREEVHDQLELRKMAPTAEELRQFVEQTKDYDVSRFFEEG